MSLVLKNLNPSDILYSTFNAYKSWNNNICFDSQSLGNSNPLQWIWVSGIHSSSFYPTQSQSIPTYLSKSIEVIQAWNHINNLFYDNYYDSPYEKNTQTLQDFILENRYLYSKASIIAIPQKQVGQGIRPGSVSLTSGSFVYIDDSKGNLIRETGVGYFTESFSDAIEIDFNDAFSLLTPRTGTGGFQVQHLKSIDYIDRFILRDKSSHKYKLLAKNVSFKEPRYGTNVSGYSPIIGTSIEFNNQYYTESYVRMLDNDTINYDIDDEFSVVLSCVINHKQVQNSATILTKNGKRRDRFYVYDRLGDTFKDVPILDKYPYAIEIDSGSNLVYGKMYDGNQILQVSCSYLPASESFISLVKTTSSLEIQYNCVVPSASNAIIPSDFKSIANNSDFFIGNRGDGSSSFSGSVNYCMMFDRALSNSELSNIYQNYKRKYYQIGNVYYKQGLFVISYPISSSASLPNSWSVNYQSTKTIHELETICNVGPAQFNVTQNPTAVDYSQNTPIIKSNVTGSEFTPYVSTIGLYNSYGDLLAVGKVAVPIRLSNLVDTNFVVRMDLEL